MGYHMWQNDCNFVIKDAHTLTFTTMFNYTLVISFCVAISGAVNQNGDMQKASWGEKVSGASVCMDEYGILMEFKFLQDSLSATMPTPFYNIFCR